MKRTVGHVRIEEHLELLTTLWARCVIRSSNWKNLICVIVSSSKEVNEDMQRVHHSFFIQSKSANVRKYILKVKQQDIQLFVVTYKLHVIEWH